jgi:DNA transformation protein
MAVSTEQAAYVLEQLERVPGLTSQKMFGGVGFSSDGLFFGFLHRNGSVFLRADDSNREDYEARGCTNFHGKTPTPGEKIKGMPFFTIPEDVLEDPDELEVWARKAIDAAAKAKK